MAIKLMIDSASDIGKEEADSLGIHLIPMVISFGEDEFLDGVNLTPAQFYEKLVKTSALPTTSQINPFRFEEEFENATKNGDEVIVITISSKLSGTYNNAVQASEKFANKVFVIDSLNACVGERLLALYALKLINDKKPAKEVAEELENAKHKIQVIAMIDTLKYLKKGGRISAAVAFAGELLSLKPMIAVIGGEVKIIGKCLGFKKAINFLDKAVAEKGGINFDMPYASIWSGTDDVNLKKYLEESKGVWQDAPNGSIPKYILGGTIGTHIGTGAVGLAFFKK